MRLSFIPDGSADCPLLMLSCVTIEELASLQVAAGDLASGTREAVALHADADSDAQLTLRVADRNIGIRRPPPAFECLLRRSSWSSIEGLIEPFLSGSSGFQWLDNSGEIALLLSPKGTW